MSSSAVLDHPTQAPQDHAATAEAKTVSRHGRTGVLLKQTRAQRNVLVDTLAAIEDAAARHHRGDPYGTQGAAAQEVLDLIAAARTRLQGLSTP